MSTTVRSESRKLESRPVVKIQPGKRRRSPWLLLVLIAVGIAALGIYKTQPEWLADYLPTGSADNYLTHTVELDDLEVKVRASGMLESASTVDVHSEVEGQVGIIRLLARGSAVTQGDVVVELDSSHLKTAMMQQRVAVQQAKAATAQAIEEVQVAKSLADDRTKAAELALKFARLDLKKYLDGDYPQEQRTIESEITLAQEELERAKDRIQYSMDLKAQGYLSQGQFDADKLVLTRCEVALQLAQEKKRLLEEFTYVRTKQDFESKIAQAERELATSTQLAEVTLEQVTNKLEAQRATEELEMAKLQHLEDQITKCQLRAPQDGVVLYPMADDEDDTVVKQGALIRQQQHVFTIPATDSLQVQASIHEAMVHLVTPGTTASIKVEALKDRKLPGKTLDVSALPDLQSWRKSTVNFYPATIELTSDVEGLRPGMNVKVSILVDEVANVLTIPVEAVVRTETETYCYCLNQRRIPTKRLLELGKANDDMVQVVSGLSAGDQVVVSPSAVEGPDA
ncbi:MAG: efflux RND transporter periplasmic adaptor subunit [Planctomycetales bacterium]|nr:efflux RND transporter periplasmic adaptor subunit [Planctomycetales bacterium]